MTIFLIFFFLYILLRFFFRDRQKRAGNVYLVGSRFSILPDHVRVISIVGMTGIALVIILLTIMGYQLTPDHIAHLLTIGIVVMSVQYLPLIIVGENGLVSIDTQVDWKDLTYARLHTHSGSAAHILLGFRSAAENASINLYIHATQIDDFEKIVSELSSVKFDKQEG